MTTAHQSKRPHLGNKPCACPTCGKPTTLYQWRDQKPVKESDAYRLRIRNLIAQFELEGYDTYDRDMGVACAVAQIMATTGSKPHLEAILAHHMERIIASQFLKETA